MCKKEINVSGPGFRNKDIIFAELDELYGQEEKVFYGYTTLKGEKLEEFRDKLKLIKELRKIKPNNKKERGELSARKGLALEELVRILLLGTGILKIAVNVGTATNEIDLVLQTNFKGMRFMSNLDEYYREVKKMVKETPSLLGFDEYFIAECKNYGKNVPATWVGKFYTLLKTCGGCNVGVIFSYNGLTGTMKNWTDAYGLTKILRSISENRCSIIDFNIEDYEAIADGKNFFEILAQKKIDLSIGAELSKYEIPHKNQKELKEKFDEYFE